LEDDVRCGLLALLEEGASPDMRDGKMGR